MKQQQYSNHIRYYPAHHLIFYPIVTLGLIISVRGIILNSASPWEWIVISSLWILMIWLSLMLRQHYALICQNRIVRMEMRFRYYVLTQKRLEPLEQVLSFKHIAALRFAPDEELPALVKRAIEEDLSPHDIKKSIKNWLPDHMRV